MVLEHMNICKKKKKKPRHSPYTLHKKNNTKWIIDLSAKGKIIIKRLEGNIRKNLDDLGHGDTFLDITREMIYERNNW